MTKDEATKLLKLHRKGNIKPTDKVREAIDVILNELNNSQNQIDEANKHLLALQNRCHIFTKGTMCAFCMMDCKHKG